MTRLEAFLHFLAEMVLPAKGRHHQPARVTAPAAVSDDTAPALTRNPHPASQEQTR